MNRRAVTMRQAGGRRLKRPSAVRARSSSARLASLLQVADYDKEGRSRPPCEVSADSTTLKVFHRQTLPAATLMKPARQRKPRAAMIRLNSSKLRVRQKLGKYRLERRLGIGGFSAVFQAMDTIEGIRVALKIPHASLINSQTMEEFRNEVRLVARLDHPNILPLKDASFVDGQFVIAFRLGERTLDDRLRRRMAVTTALDLAEQMLDGVAYAHRMNIIHCDIKPENMILFPQNRLCLTDFGIAKVAQRTISGSGTGTVGYMAPEQAMGKPSTRSDVFSLGLIIWRMLAGEWPEWPYQMPLPGVAKVRRKCHPDLIKVLLRSLDANPRKRFRDADQMLGAFRLAKRRTLRMLANRRRYKR